MKKILLGIVVLFALIACDKTDADNQQLPDGRYIGIFYRTGMDTAQVSVLFRENHYEGTTNHDKYPAICGGVYNITGNTINFEDSCSWTADFDWSLILSGSYNINVEDGAVRIWRTNGSITDEYLLRQPVR